MQNQHGGYEYTTTAARSPWRAVRGISQNLGRSNIVIDLSHRLEDIRYFFKIPMASVPWHPSTPNFGSRHQILVHDQPNAGHSNAKPFLSPRTGADAATFLPLALVELVWSSTGQLAILRVGGGLDRRSGKTVIGRGPSVHPHPGRQLTATVRRRQSGQGTVRCGRRERGRGVFMTAVPVGLCSRGPSFLVSRRRSPLLTAEPSSTPKSTCLPSP